MQISEIKPSHVRKLSQHKWRGAESIRNWLKKNKYKELGWGFHSSVWGNKDSNVIIKASTKDDPCYLKFAEIALQNKDNKHFPKLLKPRIFNTEREK